jgi:nicotinate phosphoribosyltransferase
VQAFPDELTAFRAYAAAFPDSTTLLVDTYDTLQSGIPNAIIVARELREKGHELRGVRLDSGDLAYLSRESRRLFDAAGFPAVQIVASNELDEFVIDSIRAEGGQVDIYGVGTRLATGGGRGGGALGGIYKLVAIDGQAKLKITSDIAKATLPGRKRLLRALGPEGNFIQDVICLAGNRPEAGAVVYDPTNPLQQTILPANVTLQELRRVVMREGRRTEAAETLATMAERSQREIGRLPQGCLRFINPHRYKVSICGELNELRNTLIAQLQRSMPHV